MNKSFTVVIEKDVESGMYVGYVPALSGCHSQGKTIDPLIKNMKEAISLCLEMEDKEEFSKFVGIQQVVV